MDQTITPEALQQILDALEVKLDPAKFAALQEHMQKTLQERVGLALVELLEDDEVEELVALTKGNDQPALTEWLEQHVPDYKDVVEDEINILLGDLAEGSEQL